ncbi:MAG: hypothetical protein GDA51_08185 [Ekhidna sp.]|nr:hypothetical protein [Ekhidna sp.]
MNFQEINKTLLDKLLLSQLIKLGGHSAVSRRYGQLEKTIAVGITEKRLKTEVGKTEK